MMRRYENGVVMEYEIALALVNNAWDAEVNG